MWYVFYALFLSSAFITATTGNNSVLFTLFNIATIICAAGIMVTYENQKEKIKTLENKIEKLEKLVGEDK